MKHNSINSIIGTVIKGQQISRQLGFPTLNIELADDNQLKYGVYAGTMEYQNNLYYGVMNIGITPSFKVNTPKLEIHVFNFNQNLYGEEIRVNPTHFIRDEKKFDDMDSLAAQIQSDCIIAIDLMACHYWNDNLIFTKK